MRSGRLTARDAPLSGRERRSLRRLEDAAAAEDPLLNMRLGLPLSVMARTVVATRRRAKSLGRWLADRRGWPLIVLFAVVFVLTCALAHSVALASIVASPCAFGLGLVVARRRAKPVPEVLVERRRHLGQST